MSRWDYLPGDEPDDLNDDIEFDFETGEFYSTLSEDGSDESLPEDTFEFQW